MEKKGNKRDLFYLSSPSPELASVPALVADEKKKGLWGRECVVFPPNTDAHFQTKNSGHFLSPGALLKHSQNRKLRFYRNTMGKIRKMLLRRYVS